MNNNDYYKNIELLLSETDLNVSKLSRQIKTSTQNTLIFTSNLTNETFNLKAISSTQGYIEFFALNGDSTVKISVNGLTVISSTTSYETAYAGFYEGVNELTVNATGGDYIIKVHGNVNYVDAKTNLNYFEINGVNLVTYFDGASLNFYAENNLKLSLKLKVLKILGGSVVNVTSNCVYVAYINENNAIYLGEYNVTNNSYTIVKRLNYKATSVAGYYSNNEYVIYASRLNKIYKANFTLSGSYSFEKVNVIGGDIYLNYLTNSAFITVDNLSYARLNLTNNSVISYAIPKGSNYRITQTETGYLISYFDGICYRSFNFENGKVSNNVVVKHAKEIVKLNDKTLIHFNGGLKVIKE